MYFSKMTSPMSSFSSTASRVTGSASGEVKLSMLQKFCDWNQSTTTAAMSAPAYSTAHDTGVNEGDAKLHSPATPHSNGMNSDSISALNVSSDAHPKLPTLSLEGPAQTGSTANADRDADTSAAPSILQPNCSREQAPRMPPNTPVVLAEDGRPERQVNGSGLGGTSAHIKPNDSDANNRVGGTSLIDNGSHNTPLEKTEKADEDLDKGESVSNGDVTHLFDAAESSSDDQSDKHVWHCTVDGQWCRVRADVRPPLPPADQEPRYNGHRKQLWPSGG
ncbi:hypothetical protein OPT61_g681 [Boeremia exigua]|uniref:Uncharacterized protein n=1 Tax=Boeremia exigua TaxID=749465 RepID=A0ACC2IT90_9PLEO|nr:hypothetical protein OPT61_g681 [Boeremia exigua]